MWCDWCGSASFAFWFRFIGGSCAYTFKADLPVSKFLIPLSVNYFFLFLFSSSLLGEWCGLFGWHTDIVIHKSLGTPLTAHSYYWMSALTCDFYVRCRAEHIKYNVWFDGVSRAYHQWESYAILFTDSLMYMRRIEKIKFHFMGKSSPFAKGIAMQWHFSTLQAFLHPHQSDVIYILFRLSNRLLFILDANDA